MIDQEKKMITEKQGEGQVDIEVDPVTGRRTFKIEVDDMPIERASEIIEQIKKQLNG